MDPTRAGDMVGTIFNVVLHVGPTLVRAVIPGCDVR